MKKTILFSLFVVFLAVSAFATVGKYQLISGKYAILDIVPDRASRNMQEGLYRIDTETGVVWEYTSRFERDKDGHVIKSDLGWNKLIEGSFGKEE